MDTLEEAPPTDQATSKRSGAARRRLKKQREAAALEARLAQLTLAAETPPRLPPELVYHILLLGAAFAAPKRMANGSVDDAERQSFLCTASLVCSLWREEAQLLLWTHAFIRSNEGMKSFLLSAGKARTTTLLAIQPYEGEDHDTLPPLDGQLVREVILAARGLRTLAVGGSPTTQPVELDPSIFASAEISDLECLVIHSEVLYSRSSGTQMRHLPLLLEDLVLNFIWSSRNSYFPWDLAATLLNSTLTSVNLRLFVGKPSAAVSCARNAAFRPGVVPNISSFFKPNTVRTLCLTCRSLAGEPCGAAISAYIEQCKALQELRIDSPFPDLLRALSTPLYTLAVTFSTAEMCEFVLEGLRDRWHGLSQLRILELEWAPATATNDVAARTRTWHTLRDECKRWGITFQCELPASS